MIQNMRLVRNFLNRKQTNHGVVITLTTLAICFLMSNLYWHTPMNDFLAASPERVLTNNEYWRLFTSSFIHGDLEHLLSNSFMLTLMGYFVSSQYGIKIFPILSFLMGIAINGIVISTFETDIKLVGASGIVYFLWGYWLVLYLFIQRHIPLHRRLMKIFAIGIFILAPSSYRANVSYLAHGVGLLLGIISGFIYYGIYHKKIRAFEIWEEIEQEDEGISEDSINEERNLLH